MRRQERNLCKHLHCAVLCHGEQSDLLDMIGMKLETGLRLAIELRDVIRIVAW